MQADDTEAIGFLLQSEIIPLCLRIMETGEELSKTVCLIVFCVNYFHLLPLLSHYFHLLPLLSHPVSCYCIRWYAWLSKICMEHNLAITWRKFTVPTI